MSKKKRIVSSVLGAALLFCVFSCDTGRRGPVVAESGLVVSVDRYASQVGVDILKRGGNAVDAAVAVGFSLAVTYPAAGNIGGGGFMVIRFPNTGEAVAIDFREKAPGLATSDMFLDEEWNHVKERSQYGHLAIGVPGTVKGFELAMKKYGNLTWQEVIAPAIELAENGFMLSKQRADSFNGLKKRRFKGSQEFFRIFTKPDGSDFKKGDIFVQKDLARSLRLIGKQGSEAFYEGEVGDLIVSEMERHAGLITKEDLEKYEALVRQPIIGNYRGYDIISMPPPSSGGTILVEMLNILEGFELGKMDRYAPLTLHLVSETMKFAYLDRAKYLGDVDFGEIPVNMLTSKKYAESIRNRIVPGRTLPSSEIGGEILMVEEGEETTHFSVIDEEGMAVSTTYTLNDGYGSGVIAEGSGILLNNEMRDFNMKLGFTDNTGFIGTRPNIIEPYKKMLSSMTPTIVVKDGKTFMITGSPGGRTIINTVLNVIINVIDFKMEIQDAVNARRIDHEWMPDELSLEEGEIPKKTIDALKTLGHSTRRIKRQGDAHTILIDPDTGVYYGAADPRSKGTAIGY